jgi:hypothetical protein
MPSERCSSQSFEAFGITGIETVNHRRPPGGFTSVGRISATTY